MEEIEPIRGEDGRVKWFVEGVPEGFDSEEEAREWLRMEER